ncbi:MAG TPA: DNA repair protein RecN [Longimicrobiales bacterium]|nr:DNA repair protein RecN [Longimicrobiales bacterium]
MLLELRIQNLAVIEHVSIRLERGLNVLTGETGAGKSIIVGALSLLLGERASAELVRPGAERALVEGVFDVAGAEDVLALLSEQGIAAEDGLLILRREVAAEGRNRAWVNGSPATASTVGALGRRLVDLHGQHEHQTLLRGDEQRAILDAFAGAEGSVAEVAAAHARLRRATAELEGLEARRREAEAHADLLRFQAEEIEAARLEPDEEEELTAEAHRLEHAEELAGLADTLHQALYADEEAIAARLDGLRRTLDQLLRIDPDVGDAREMLESAFHNVEEVGRLMGDYASGVEHDPGRLAEVRRRQDLLFRLKRKYGESVEGVIEAGARARRELDLVDRAAFERRALEKEETEARGQLEEAAGQLTRLRTKASKHLEKEVTAVLPHLGLAGGRFEVSLAQHPVPTAAGAEGVEFHVSLNVGFEPRPLARVASGGELSRVMLALKSVLAAVDRVPSLVFDEIDAGVGGQVAHQVAGRLGEVAVAHQVFAITHLPQIAARADHHVRVEKGEREGTTLTRLTSLEGDERVREIARMLGDPDGAASVEHARELLGQRGSARAGS